jgi:hypothetical protein
MRDNIIRWHVIVNTLSAVHACVIHSLLYEDLLSVVCNDIHYHLIRGLVIRGLVIRGLHICSHDIHAHIICKYLALVSLSVVLMAIYP